MRVRKYIEYSRMDLEEKETETKCDEGKTIVAMFVFLFINCKQRIIWE